MKNSVTLILFIFLALGVNSQLVSLSNFIKGKTEIQNCKTQFQGVCLQCDDGYKKDQNDENCIAQNPQPQQEESQPQSDSQPSSSPDRVPDDVNPCGERNNCGKSSNFQSEKKFSQFLSKYQQNQQFLIREPQPLAIQDSSAQQRSIPSPNAFAPNAQQSLISPQSASSGAASRDFSGTNNQEENVDEADLLKTDGTYIYTISNGVLSIIRGYPTSKAKVLSTIQLNLNPSALFIEGDYLALFGTSYEGNQFIYWNEYQLYGNGYRSRRPLTFLRVYNIKNRLKPYLIRDIRIEGRYFNGRKTQDGFMYLLSIQNLYQRVKPYPWYSIGYSRNYAKLGSIFLYEGDYYRPIFVNIFSFDLKNPFKRNNHNLACIITENAQVLYMSENYIYLTYQDYRNGYKDYTVIHKVFVWKKFIIPFADGLVRGRVNNQFSLDEHNDVLRIATTSNNPRASNVFCLDYYLEQLGKITGIAPGQSIFSARYVNRRLYLVTFRQVDPFFVISLDDHTNPKILGELKITGFSRYLHPYDEKTIIGLGRQATSTGRQLGLKISLFDVSDVQYPVESASFELQERYASSSAEWEHKAFLFSRAKNLLVIPGRYSSSDTKFNGAFVFYIDRDQIVLRGIVDHFTPGDNFYQRAVQRSLYIEDFLYTKSLCLLKINLIEDLYGVKDIKIPCQKTPQPKPQPINPFLGPIIRNSQ